MGRLWDFETWNWDMECVEYNNGGFMTSLVGD